MQVSNSHDPEFGTSANAGDTLKMGNSGFETGMRVRVTDGVHEAGRCGSIVGNEVLAGQWWCPVLWDDADDPDFIKSSCLEPLGGMDAKDWQELLHTLTREMQRVMPPDLMEMRVDRIMSIVGKIGSGDMDKLDVDELDEIHRSLMLDAENCVDGEIRLRTISGKIGPGSTVADRQVLQAVSREELLARLYRSAPMEVSRLCDEELDKSGALLARVREMSTKLV